MWAPDSFPRFRPPRHRQRYVTVTNLPVAQVAIDTAGRQILLPLADRKRDPVMLARGRSQQKRTRTKLINPIRDYHTYATTDLHMPCYARCVDPSRRCAETE